MEMDLADNITRYWTNFAHYGNPNGNFTAKNAENTLNSSKGLGAGMSSHTLLKDKGPTLPDWPSYYVDKITGTKQAGCMRFRTPMSEVNK